MKVQGSCLQCFLLLVAIGLWGASPVSGQALHTEELTNGTLLVVVAEPLSDATTAAWSGAGPDEPVFVVTSGDMTLIADLEAAVVSSTETTAPPVVIVVGGAPLAEIRGVLDRTLAGRPARASGDRPVPQRDDGRTERRLGTPGDFAEIRLRVNLPPPSDPVRSSAEVLWDLLPDVLSGELGGLRSRVDGHVGVLEARINADDADLSLRKLRLGLARFSEDPRLQESQVEVAARRLFVQRRALLEKHPRAATHLLDLWTVGGTAAVKEFLFAAEAVTLSSVRDAARRWLPRHPGNTVVVLPPQALNPRFAAPPEVIQLESGLTAAVLERSGSPLSVVCLRPVIVPELDDEIAATILTRVARELRSVVDRPGWLEVISSPPQLQIAAPSDGFAELMEVLRAAVDTVADDERTVPFGAGDSRRRALHMMAELLGVAEGSELTPSALLRPDNLALGVVAVDGEAAAEAIRKFWTADPRSRSITTVQTVPPVPRIREAVAGSQSSVVTVLEMPPSRDEALSMVISELLTSRGKTVFPDVSVEVLSPFVPGRSMALLVVTGTATLEDLEGSLREGLPALFAPADEEELTGIRRRVAAAAAARWSGATGRARRCAAVATGMVWWRPASELELGILSAPADMINLVLGEIAQSDELQDTAAGVLPIVEIGD